MTGGDRPTWPDDVLYVPVADQDADDPKGPDLSAIPGTWDTDGTGCATYDDTHDRRYGVVDVVQDEWRLLTIDLDLYKIDDPEFRQQVLDGLDKVPDTRIHNSLSGGKHLFYWIKEDELNEDGTLPVSYVDTIDDKLNGYVLSAEFCEGYEVENDRQLAEIAVEDIPDEWITPESTLSPNQKNLDTIPVDGSERDRSARPSHDLGNHVREAGGSDASRRDSKVRDPTFDDLSVYDVLSRANYPPGERVGHPLGPRHSGGGTSTTGSNFMVDEDGETWRCWRHGTTGNAIHLVGMEEGLIKCGEWDNRTIPTRTWSSVFERAEDRGLIEQSPRKMDPDDLEETATPTEDDDRQHFDSLTPPELPEDNSYALIKPPREGGSYIIMVNFTNRVEDICILASRHHILEYHRETISDLLPSEASAVHYQGQHTACEADDPGNCDKTPDGYAEYMELKQEVRDARYRKSIITPDDAPPGVCPYWFVKEAAEQARAVLTVPQLFHRLDRDWGEMNVLIDEEQTNDAFLPGSAELIEVGWDADSAGNTVIQTQNDNLTAQYETAQKIRERIKQDQQVRKEGEGDWRRNSWEKDVNRAIETVGQLREALAVQDLDAEQRRSLTDTINTLEERLEDIGLPERNTDPDKLKQKINEYCAPYFWDEEANPSGLLESLLFPYEDNPFHFKRTGGSYTLRLIGDRGEYLFHQDILEQCNQIAMIAGPEGERVLKRVDDDPETLVIDEFRYADDFVVVPVGKERDDDLGGVGAQRARVKRIAGELNRRSIPQIAVAGTSEQAHDLTADYLRDEGAAIPTDPDSPALTLHTEWSAGNTVGIYENSVVSRGIDAPFFDVTTITSTGFAAPYWEARRDYYKTQEGEDARDQYREAAAVEVELKARELTNAALRMAPTYTVKDKYGTKFIIAASSDVNRLKYLQDRVAPRMESVEEVADLIDVLTASGELWLGAEKVYDNHNQSEKEFIEVVSEESIKPKRQSRPEYEIEEVVSWVDENHVTNRNYLERVNREIHRLREPTTREVCEHLPSMSNKRVLVGLNILERKGVVEEDIEDSNDVGQPEKRWKPTKIPL